MTEEWPVLESVAEYETPWFTGGYDLVEQPDGSTKRYYWAELPPAVVVVAVARDQVVFVEQYRPVVRQTQLELPAGLVEDGESFTAAAERELREETGYDPAGTALLQEEAVATGVLRHRRGYVFAEGLDPGEASLDDNEFLTVRTVPVEESLAAARAEPTNDATVAGLLLADEEGLL
jgi:ADP-ribose pyrophosphatase